MAQVFRFPSSISFEIAFDELSLFREAGWRAGSISGTAEITYQQHTDDWFVSDITIQADNAKVGKEALGKTLSLNGQDHPELYWLLLNRLTETYEVQIVETIDAELASVGQRRAA